MKSITIKSLKQGSLANQQTSGSKIEHQKKMQTPQKSENLDANSRHVSGAKKAGLQDLDHSALQQSQNYLYFNQDTSKNSLKNHRLNDNLQKMPKIKNTSQGGKLYSGKIRSPLQGIDKGPHLNDIIDHESEKADMITESFTLNNESSKLQLHPSLHQHHGRKEDSHAVTNTLSLQEDFDKIEKLSMINANARYELITANQQLIDFQMNRYIKHTKDQRKLKLAG